MRHDVRWVICYLMGLIGRQSVPVMTVALLTIMGIMSDARQIMRNFHPESQGYVTYWIWILGVRRAI